MLNDEGGFSLRPPNPDGTGGEPGGSVNKGISMLVFEEWRKKHGKPPPTIDDLRNLTTDEAKEIYTDRWNQLQGDDLPSGLDYALFDASTMIGIVGARALLQTIVEPLRPPSGHYDQDTWIAIRSGNVQITAIRVLLALSLKKLRSKSAGKYGTGWADRIKRVEGRTLEMMK
jgi:lysozyme family protein